MHHVPMEEEDVEHFAPMAETALLMVLGSLISEETPATPAAAVPPPASKEFPWSE